MRSTFVRLGIVLLGTLTSAAPARAQEGADSLTLLPAPIVTGWFQGGVRGVSGLDLYRRFDAPGFYVSRTRFADGRGLGPHRHERALTVTVLQGVFRLGIGERVDSSAARAYAVGSFLIIPAGVPHYEWGEGETVIQLGGEGPLGFAWAGEER
jgi:quercetin dioxygenase-like cupin family protein